jgi:hypothetical protein
MARRPRKPPSDAALERAYLKQAMARLARKMMCAYPHIADLSPTQHFALHEFFSAILHAGYKLYRFVPPKYADKIMKEKFGLIFPPDNPKPKR